MTDHHFYAATAYGWCTASTKQAAIVGVARDAGARLLASARKSKHRGLIAIVVKVNLPEQAHYEISDHLPSIITREDGVNAARKGERVPMDKPETIVITSLTGNHSPLAERAD